MLKVKLSKQECRNVHPLKKLKYHRYKLLGVSGLRVFTSITSDSAINAIKSFYTNLPDQSLFVAHMIIDTQQAVFGYKASGSFGAMLGVTYSSDDKISVFAIQNYNSNWVQRQL